MRRLAHIALVIGATSGCELLVSNSLNLLHCDSGKCNPGYSCRVDQCVALSSLKPGDTCSDVAQCQAGLVCPPGINQCSQPCTKIYQFNDNECTADQVCAPVFDRKSNAFSGGACVQNECSANAFCQDQGNADSLHFATPSSTTNCVRLAQNGGLCLQTCLIGPRAADPGGGPDACAADTFNNPTHCGIINPGAAPDYICLPAGNAAAGAACSLFPLGGNSGNAPSADACGLNQGSEPLICMTSSGTLTGDLRCQQVCANKGGTLDASFCSSNEQCTPYQDNGFAYCAPPT